MSVFIACFRLLRLAVHLLYGALLAVLYPHLPCAQQGRILQNWSANVLRILHVRLDDSACATLRSGSPGLVVANHISWLDIFLLNAVLPLRFVAKSEVRDWPFIGWLCVRAGTFFVARGQRQDVVRVNQQLCDLLQQGAHVALFPEGTTTSGTEVKHFHASLLQAAIDAAVPVYPVTLCYQDREGQYTAIASYVDDMTFMQSLWKICCYPAIQARLMCGEPLPSAQQNRRELATAAHGTIAVTLHASLAPTEHFFAVPQPTQSFYSLLLSPQADAHSASHPS